MKIKIFLIRIGLALAATIILGAGGGLIARKDANAANGTYKILAWNDLGMHCYNRDFSDLAVLPPYNTLWVQVIKAGNPPTLVKTGITVEYSYPDNTYSVGKTNFWSYAQPLFGVTLAPNVGLKGKGLSGTMDFSVDHFVAEGIPVTEFSDSAPTTSQPYQLATVIVKDSATGAELARTQVVTPVSSEMRCDKCHSDTGEAKPDNPTGKVETNILQLHDEEEGTSLMTSRPVLCANCHGSNALGMTGNPNLPNLSKAMHKKHDGESPNTLDGCYNCHPGPQTKCLRDTMSAKGMTCISCHGTMSTVKNNPNPWLNEPRCDTCHNSGQYNQNHALYRFSTEHGGLYCEACHDSTHAVAPSREANDAIKFVALQGKNGPIDQCQVCHTTVPTSGTGPHGMAPSPFTLPTPWIGGISITSDKNIVAVGRPHIGSEITAYDGFSAGAHTAYVPMLFKNAFVGGGYDSAFYIQNVDSALATISIAYYDSTGALTCTAPDTISPLASKGYWLPGLSASCLPDGWVGGAVVTSDKNIVANGRPHINGEVMTYDSFSSGSLTSYLPMLFKNAFVGGAYDSAFYVQNVDPTNTAALNIKYYDSMGTLTCTVTTETVAPLASKGYWLPALAASCIPDGWVGGVVVTSTTPIVTVGRPHIGTQITTYTGFSAGSGYSSVPMLFKNAMVGGAYNSAFYVQNLNPSTTANLNIKYYQLDGTLTCTVTTETIAPLASKGYWLPALSAACLPDGWVGGAVVTSNVDIVAIGRPHIGAQIMTYNGFTSGSLSSYLPMLFKDAFANGSYDSAFYIQNTEATVATVITKFYDNTGALTCMRSDTLAGFSTLSLWTPSLTCIP